MSRPEAGWPADPTLRDTHAFEPPAAKEAPRYKTAWLEDIMGLQRTIKAPVRVARGAFRLGRGLWRRVSPQASADTGEVTGSPPAPEPPPAAAPPLDIRVEETPNPEARKLVFDYVVVPEGSVVASAQGAGAPAWVDALFEVGGVRTVFATRDFITVTRSPEGPPWPSLLPQLERALQASLPRGASTRS